MHGLNKKEEQWIKNCNSVAEGYNLQAGGFNRIHSEESLQKMSQSIRRRNSDPVFMEKFREAIKKSTPNPEYNKKRGDAQKRIAYSPKSIERRRKYVLKTSVPVIAVSLLDGSVLEFSSLHDAEKAGFSRRGITLCIRGTHRQHKGYTWKYKDNQ
jgi:hypothetical protein